MSVRETLSKLRNVQDEIKHWKKIEEDIKAELAEADMDDYVLPDGTIATIQPNIRFSAVAAKKNLPAEQFDAICKKKPDAALAKALLDDDYYLCQAKSGVKITFKNPNN